MEGPQDAFKTIFWYKFLSKHLTSFCSAKCRAALHHSPIACMQHVSFVKFTVTIPNTDDPMSYLTEAGRALTPAQSAMQKETNEKMDKLADKETDRRRVTEQIFTNKGQACSAEHVHGLVSWGLACSGSNS